MENNKSIGKTNPSDNWSQSNEHVVCFNLIKIESEQWEFTFWTCEAGDVLCTCYCLYFLKEKLFPKLVEKGTFGALIIDWE